MADRSDLNLLVIIADQFRADLLDGRLSDAVATPNIDRLGKRSMVLTRHHTVAVPCAPSRASLLTGLYPSEHGAKRNAQALNLGLTNIALELRRIGREPLLFGYTDTQPNPETRFPRDPANLSMSGPMEGFSEVVEMRDEAWRWLAHLRARGYDVPDAGAPDFDRLYRPQGGVFGGPALYSADDSDTAFLTRETIRALDVRKSAPWSAFVTFIRPHPPFVAPAPYHDMIAPGTVPAPLETDSDHPFLKVERTYPSSLGMFWGHDGYAARLDPDMVARVRATYLGLVAELDAGIGKLLSWLDDTGQTDTTLIVFTADHGEMLGDFGLWGKLSPFPQASHIPFFLSGPEVEPRHHSHVTQSVQVMPALLDYLQGGPMSDFAHPDPAAKARVEMVLGDPGPPTRFQQAWNRPDSDIDCIVTHDATTRSASFDGAAPTLHMNPADGTPIDG